MFIRYKLFSAGTNDQSSNASLTTSKLTNTITRLQNEGYEVVLVPPNKDSFGVQYDAADAAAGLKGVSIHEAVFQNSVPNKLTTNSATLIRNTYPNAFIVGDDNAVLINNGIETPNAVTVSYTHLTLPTSDLV